MKRIISLISIVMFVTGMFAQQTVYYISPTGDDMLNTGLSAESPYKTLEKVFEVEVALTNEDILINVASGVYPQSTIVPTTDYPLKITIKGESAESTIFERSTHDPIVNEDFRFFTLQTGFNAGLELTISDVTLKGFGNRMDKNWQGAVINANNTTINDLKISFTRCMFKDIAGAKAAIMYSSNPTYIVVFDGCYFENCQSFQIANTQLASRISGLIHIEGGDLTVKNCIFNKNTRNPLHPTSGVDYDMIKTGVINLDPRLYKITAKIINNTFIGNTVAVEAETVVTVQPTIMIAELTTTTGNGVDLTMLNNLFVENKRTGFANDVDLYIAPADVNIIDVRNNVLNNIITTDASEFLSTTTNSISGVYTYTSSEIDFDMEAGLPKVYLGGNGVNYVVARGDSVVAQGVSNVTNSEVPTIDITGATRKSAPDIGATDIFIAGSSLNTQNISGVKIYTNGKTLMAKAENGTGFSIKVSDITGRTLYASDVSSSFARTFDYRGIILVTIENKQGVVTRKVII